MALPNPFHETMSESWLRTARELEQTLTGANSDVRVGPYFDMMRNLRPLVDLTRQIGATKYAQSYRAGTSLRESLIISTTARYRLEPDEPFIIVSVERMAQGTFGFCILYYEGGEASEKMQALVKIYGTDDFHIFQTNLRRDLPNYYYPCAYADAWESLQPLMVRLWNETHSA